MKETPKKDMMKEMTAAQRAYETKRAAKARMSLDKWLATKEKDAAKKTAEADRRAAPKKKPGLFSRLLDRAHKPL